MAARGQTLSRRKEALGSPIYWAAAALALALSLAAALLTLFGPDGGGAPPARLSPAAERALLGERIAFFEQRLEADTFNVVALNTLTAQYLQRARETGDIADYNRALRAAERSVSTLPGYFPSVIAAATAKNAVHDFASALDYATQAVELRPGQAAGYALRGDALVALGRYEEAGFDYQKMVALEPSLAALSRLAHLAFLEGDATNAEDFWKQAVSLGRDLPAENEAWARIQLSLLYFDRGDLKKAQTQAGSALELYPDYVPALAATARIAAARGDFARAIAGYERVVRRQPLVEYVIALGETYEAAGRVDDAQRQYALVGAIAALYRANGINTDVSLALFYTNHGLNPAEALTLAENGYRAGPGVYSADALAWALLKDGQPQEAALYSEEALRLGTPDAALLYHAGMVQKALGQNDRALELLDRALRTNPAFSPLQAPFAQAALAELKGLKGRSR